MIMQKLLIGIDGGGTKTHLVLSDLSGAQLAEAFGGPSNPMAYSLEIVRENLSKLILPVIASLSENQEVAGICLGSAGVSLMGSVELLSGILKDICPMAEIVVLGDMEIALAANSTSPIGAGILLVCGTGSICFGKDEAGESARAGGWGHIVSDEGSGYWIGKEAIKHVFHVTDGRAALTPIYAAVLRALHCETPRDLVSFLASSEASKARVAGICQIVENCAIIGDRYAIAILENAARELVALVEAVTSRLSFSSVYSVLLNGSVITKCAPLRERFLQLMQENPQAVLSEVTVPAACGAVQVLINKMK
ncbi:MAG: BadF/BadG/BcrA/BcrD ATPase family protein [Oscillospiraceae bacterium]